MDYIVASATGPVQLATDVLWWMEKGYKPQGGVAILSSPIAGAFYYYQAMIKED